MLACAMTAGVCACTALAAVPAGLVTATLGADPGDTLRSKHYPGASLLPPVCGWTCQLNVSLPVYASAGHARDNHSGRSE